MIKWSSSFHENEQLLKGECSTFTVGVFDQVFTLNNKMYVLGLDGYGGIYVRRGDGKYLNNNKEWVNKETAEFGECYILIPKDIVNKFDTPDYKVLFDKWLESIVSNKVEV